jgi:hypothetical protein|tara:strand:+ start:540 stop:728 length:189 start_codon:yes stop_codon:yes gene_type:complete
MRLNKVDIRVIAEVDSDEFTLDTEEMPSILEEQLEDLFHEITGINVKDITIRIINNKLIIGD